MGIAIGIVVWLVVIVLVLLFFHGAKPKPDCTCKGCSHEDDDCCTVDTCMQEGTEAAKAHIQARPTGKEWDEFDRDLKSSDGTANEDDDWLQEQLQQGEPECHCDWERPDVCRQCNIPDRRKR